MRLSLKEKGRKNGGHRGIHSQQEKGITEQIHIRKEPKRIKETEQYYLEIYVTQPPFLLDILSKDLGLQFI